MTALTIHNKISIVDLVFFVPALFIGGLLMWRHGLRRSAGWIYLALLSLMRVLGSSMQLATISSPTNYHLIIGAQTLQNIGLSPLVLVLLGLITRVYLSLPEKQRPTLPNARILRVLQLLIVVALILTIVGGIDIGNQVGDDIVNGRPVSYTVASTTKAGVGLMIAGFVLLTLSALVLTTQLGRLPKGENRVLLAVCGALPFVLVRLVYSGVAAFDGSNSHFRQFGGSADAGYYLLGMCTIMEIICVTVFEAVGLTLPHTSRVDKIRTAGNNGRYVTQTGETGETYAMKQARQPRQPQAAYV